MVPDYFGKEVHTDEVSMNMTDLKKMCEKELEKYPEWKKDFKKEYLYAKNFFKNNIDLYKAFQENEITGRYLIPFLLGFTDGYDEVFERAQVFNGASGGIDVDTDLSPSARDELFEYLQGKYGKDRVFHVGTYSKLGVKSAAKDLLRIYKVDFKSSNAFTSLLDGQMSWEDNIELIKANYPKQYKFYEQNKEVLDLTTHFDGKVRQLSKHAGGMLVLDRPVHELIPVERVSGEVISAFPESGQDAVLDDMGLIKFDMLGLSTLDVISATLDKVNEKMYLIEDDDGIRKVVPQSYVDRVLEKI
jgi:voltage-gated potassium channel Kch